jgi:hypothetical protein
MVSVRSCAMVPAWKGLVWAVCAGEKDSLLAACGILVVPDMVGYF